MTVSTDQNGSERTGSEPSSALADYADRLLLGTSLDAADAVLLATGDIEPAAELSGLARALQAGWKPEEEAA